MQPYSCCDFGCSRTPPRSLQRACRAHAACRTCAPVGLLLGTAVHDWATVVHDRATTDMPREPRASRAKEPSSMAYVPPHRRTSAAATTNLPRSLAELILGPDATGLSEGGANQKQMARRTYSLIPLMIITLMPPPPTRQGKHIAKGTSGGAGLPTLNPRCATHTHPSTVPAHLQKLNTHSSFHSPRTTTFSTRKSSPSRLYSGRWITQSFPRASGTRGTW